MNRNLPQGATGRLNAIAHASRLLPEQVIFRIDEAELPVLDESHTTFGIIGQERAMQAIEMALSIRSKGYNIFVTGPAGTGKRSAILHILKQLPLEPSSLQDLAFVNNPVQEISPRILYFPKGQAQGFRKALRKTILDIQTLAQEIQHQQRFQEARDQYMAESEYEENQILFNFEGRVEQQGFKIVQIEEDNKEKADLAAVLNDNLTNIQDIQQMVAQGQIEEDYYLGLRTTYLKLMEEMKQVFQSIQKRRRKADLYILELLKHTIQSEVRARMEELKKDYPYPEVCRHLDDLVDDIIEHLPLFLADTEEARDQADDEEPANQQFLDLGSERSQDPASGASSAGGDRAQTREQSAAGAEPGSAAQPASKKKNLAERGNYGAAPGGQRPAAYAAPDRAPFGSTYTAKFSLPDAPGATGTLAFASSDKPRVNFAGSKKGEELAPRVAKHEMIRRRSPKSGGRNEFLSAVLSGNLHLPEHLLRYDVNIIVDNSATDKPPVIFETYPDFQKLFGTIDPPAEFASGYAPPGTQTAASPGAAIAASLGLERPGFLNLRAGSLLRANGGFLILQAEDLLIEEETYISLKRVLQNGSLELRSSPSAGGSHAGSALKPEPIAINLKVVILGSEMLYDALYLQDDDFQKLFKVPAEFDYTMDRNESTTREYLNFIRMVAEDEKLLPVANSARAALLEYGVRLAELRDKLCTKFSLIADTLREANYWAGKSGKAVIDRDAIVQALSRRAFLLNLPEEKIDEQIRTGELLIKLEGEAIGRVNGLAVLDRGYYSFGRPTVISAQAAPGSDGIINVEREAGLSGEIHDKGTYIVESYIHATYARDYPFSITARICFEQSYVEVDGDSASSSEIYAILSAIGRIPLRQDIAVTGSVNQMGEIQPVGGVIEKIEGFYSVCVQRGLTGTQGVIIPALNVESLVLNSEVNAAVSEGRFHIWAIRNIDEGMEILSALPAGKRNEKGQFPAGSFNRIIDDELRRMARISAKAND